jgi:hypothetical protein
VPENAMLKKLMDLRKGESNRNLEKTELRRFIIYDCPPLVKNYHDDNVK